MMKYPALLLLAPALCFGAEYQTGQAARLVIGQHNFTATDSGASDTLLGGVGGVAYANNTLFIADSVRFNSTPANNRVLIYRNLSFNFPQTTDEFGAYQPIRCPACVGQANVVVGQPDFLTTTIGLSQTTLRQPTAVASDGKFLVIADTDNNRVLIWNSIPTTNGAPADIVLGQPDFKTLQVPSVTNQKSFRGPQGVWIQGTKLFVADTQNHRVLIWNSIPTSNNQPADMVLGQQNFTTAPEQDLTKPTPTAAQNNLLNPVSVTSDGTHLYVTDLGYNRVLIWNSIPTQNQQPADVVLGQPDFVSSIANNSSALCHPSGTDSSGKNTYPDHCGATLNFPRFTLSDGQRLYIADGGNDRVLVFNQIPTTNGKVPDVILGQPDEFSDVVTDTGDLFNPNFKKASPDTLRTPTALAWDGTSLYVTDPFDRRVLVFTPGYTMLPINGVVNAAARYVYATGRVTIGGTITANDTVTLTINGKDYKYTIVSGDTTDSVAKALIALINGANNGVGDPNVLARFDKGSVILLNSRLPGDAGNSVTLANTLSTNATITATLSAANLTGGAKAATIAPGTIVTLLGQFFTDGSGGSADPNANPLPTKIAGVTVYVDGIPAPLQFVSPTQINAQVPYEVSDASASSIYVRSERSDGSVIISQAVAIPIVPQSPGIFALDGTDPRPGIVMHGSSYASVSVSVDGTIKGNDTVTITIEDRAYTYTVLSTDSLANVRDALIKLINANAEEKLVASPGGVFTRVILQSKVAGPDGNGITVAVSTSSGASVILTPSHGSTCCANVEGSLVTADNPAAPGETITVYATGLGRVSGPDAAVQNQITGYRYYGPALNDTGNSVSSLAGRKTANVLSAGLMVGMIGVYAVKLELASDLTSDPLTQLTIAQDIYTSNIVTFPLVAP